MGTDDVRFDERGWSADRPVDMRLGGEVHEGVDPFLTQQARHEGPIADVAVYESKPGLALEWREAHPVACIGERIENDQPVARVPAKPVMHEIGPDETSATGYEQSTHSISL